MLIRQQHSFSEFRGNTVWVVVLISDSVAGVSNPLASADIETDILQFSTLKKDLEMDVGAFAVDELDFSIDESALLTETDGAALEFILQAQQESRYLTVWLFDTAIPTEVQPDDADLRAIILPDISADEVSWAGSEWNMNPSPLRVWSMKAQSLDVSILDEKLEILLRQPLALGLIPINTFSELSHFANGSFAVNTVSMISLSRTLEVLAVAFNSIPAEERTVGTGGITISFGPSPITSYSLSPARWNVSEFSINFESPLPYDPAPFPSTNGFTVFDDDVVHVELFGSDPLRDLYISSSLITPALVDGQESGEHSYSWRKYESFAELLFDIARSLGVYIRFEFIENDHVQIRFAARNSLSSTRIELRDATQAAIDSTAGGTDDLKPFSARGTRFSNDGWRLLRYNRDNTFLEQSGGFVEEPDTVRLPLSISPQVVLYGHTIGKLENWSFQYAQVADCLLPVNTISVGNGNNTHGYLILEDWARALWGTYGDFGRRDLTTALYLRVRLRNERIETARTDYLWENEWKGGYYHGNVYPSAEPSSDPVQLLPVGQLHCVIDGTQRDFSSLTAYLNEIASRDKGFFEREYQITVPYISAGFRVEGSPAASWRALRLGATVALDGVDYIVVGIERNIQDVSSTLRLHRSSKAALAPAPGRLPGTPDQSGMVRPIIPDYSEQASADRSFGRFIASENIPRGMPVALRSDGTVEVASAHVDYYARILGVAVQNIPAERSGLVALAGQSVYVDGVEVLPEETPIFLRTLPPFNLSDEPPTPGSGETLYQSVGVIRSGVIVVELGQPYIME